MNYSLGLGLFGGGSEWARSKLYICGCTRGCVSVVLCTCICVSVDEIFQKYVKINTCTCLQNLFNMILRDRWRKRERERDKTRVKKIGIYTRKGTRKKNEWNYTE